MYRTVYMYYSGLNLVKDMKDYEAGTLYRHTYYEYDSLGRISAKAESNSEMTDAEKSAKAVSYTYNLRGEVTGTGYGSSLTNIAAGEISGTRYEYNSYGQLTGLLYLNARFYDPATDRFISQDTYRGERDDAGTWHLYAYCANDPVNYVDPSGHNPLVLGLGIGIVLAYKAGTIVFIGTTAWVLGSQLARVKSKNKKTHYYKATIHEGQVCFRKGLTKAQAIARLKNKGDVIATTARRAREVCEAASPLGLAQHDGAHYKECGYRKHYHPVYKNREKVKQGKNKGKYKNRIKAHCFY